MKQVFLWFYLYPANEFLRSTPWTLLMQVQRLHAFAFPLAEVAVAVAVAHPEFMDLLLARLHKASTLAIQWTGLRRSQDLTCASASGLRWARRHS